MRSKWASVLLLLFCISSAQAQTKILDVAYGDAPGQKLDVYPSLVPNSPVVMLIHGGAWFGGQKSDLADLAEFLRARTFTVVSIDYRVSWQATFPANIQDVSCALAHVKLHASSYNADPSHVALLGYSAGGHLALLQATANTRYLVCEPPVDLDIDAMIGVCGIYSFKHRIVGDPDRLLQMLGDSAKYWEEADPIQHLEGLHDEKFLLITDAVDWTVPPQNTYDLFDSLERRDIDVKLYTFYSKDHFNILSSLTAEDSVIRAITEFLDSLWPPRAAVVDTEAYDVDMRFEGREIEIFSRYNGRMIIYDLLGRIVSSFDLPHGVSRQYLWNVPYGCYFTSMLANGRRTTVRVILD